MEAQKVEKLGAQRKGDALERLCWAGPPDDRELRFAAAFASGHLEVRNTEDGKVLGAARLSSEGGVRCLEPLGRALLALSSDGSLAIIEGWCDDEPCWPRDGEILDATTASTSGEGQVAGKEKKKKTTKKPAAAAVKCTKLPGPISDAQVDPCNPSRLAFGGGDNDVKVYDLVKEEICWKAKNVRENSLCLAVPVRVATIRWATELPREGGAAADKKKKQGGSAKKQQGQGRSLILCGTSDGKIRAYDVDTQRKPLFEHLVAYQNARGTGGYTGAVEDVPRPVSCSAIAEVRGGEWGYFIGNTMGVLREYDLKHLPTAKAAAIPPGRKSHLKLASRSLPFKLGYKGTMGSIRQVSVHCSGEVLVTVGLGRFAFIFDTTNRRKRRLLSKVYLKQKLCCCLFSAEQREVDKKPVKASDEGDVTGEEEEMGPSEDEVREGFTSDEEENAGDEEEAKSGKDGEDEGEGPTSSGAVRGKTMKKPVSRKRLKDDAAGKLDAPNDASRPVKKRKKTEARSGAKK